ncbi:MAG: hypothetical protein HYY84_15085 [Deltaproteobacteria bacterium]|nr:hypothetical protein [Deltaproteobacteria bacterium]
MTKGFEKGPIEVSPVLRRFLDGERTKPLNAFTLVGSGFHFTGKIPARIVRVERQPYGYGFVVVERASGGFIVNMFPAVRYRESSKSNDVRRRTTR